MMQRRPTSFDIAALAGVSQPTVSRALSGNPSVSEATRAKVLAAAEQLNYKVDKNASGLRRRHSRTLALLFFEEWLPGGAQINPFYLSLLGPMVRRCAEHGYDLLISFQQLSSNWHLDYEDSHKADGIILLGYGDYLEYRPKLEQLIERGAHFVRWGAATEGQLGNTVSSDNEQGGFDAASHLLKHGRRRIAFVGTAEPGYPEFLERWRGYCRGLRAAGIEPDELLCVSAEPSEESGIEAVEKLLERGAEFDAIFAASDVAAIGAMHALQSHGLAIPANVAVVGFDDIPAASLSTPRLTTVTQDPHPAAEMLIDTLVDAIEMGEIRNSLLPVHLTVRDFERLRVSEFTRREMIGAGALALGLAGTVVEPGHAQILPSPDSSPRRRVRLERWRFHLGHAADMDKDFGFGRDQRTFAKAGASADAARADFDDSRWADVQVPHDWAVALPFAPPKSPPAKDRADSTASHGFKAIGRDFPQNSIGWYRTPIAITAADKDPRIWLEFDGVFRDAIVFVNGYVAGRNESGYAPFRVEIDDFLNYDGKPNVITVRADASLGEGWFYEGAGIYRHVDLVIANPVHIPQWGTFVRSELRSDGALVRAQTEVFNSGAAPASVVLRQSILGGRSNTALPDTPLALGPGERRIVKQEVLIKTPLLWSLDEANLYTLYAQVEAGGIPVDDYSTSFGIRDIRFDAQRGFFLNGRPVKLLGTANHQDHAGVGAGIPDALHRWRVAQLQEMGSNAWRSAHNPPATALLDACDRMGMLMIVEARYNSTDEEALSQLERIVRRDRNHPSVILWSLGNEEPHQATERGARINTEMARHVKRLDPTRPTTFAMDQGWDTGIGRVVDVLGFNYRTNQIEAYHGRHPEQPVYGSETGSTVATRGEYANDAKRHIVRAYDTEHPWWATTAEEWWTIVADRPYIAGGFVWTGFDYRGEPTPYAAFPSISSQFGILDTCGFPKDDYYYYRAWWRPDRPLVHLLPHWNWPGRAGQPIEVWAHGNTEEVELLLNGKSLGRKAMPRNRHLEWRVPYAPGKLEAVGYNGGQVAARDIRETTGPAHAVELIADRRVARGGEAVIVNASVVDSRGRVVPTANNLLFFGASGGMVIGVGNGDPNSTWPDVALHRRAFNGFAQCIVRVERMSGPVDIAVEGSGLKGTHLRIVAL